MRRRAALLLPLLTLALAACGAGKEVQPLPEGATDTIPQQATTETGQTETAQTETQGGGEVQGDPAAGKSVFASAGCVSCHTLSAAAATGTIGPNLDEVKPAYDLIIERVTNGKSPMPAFKGQLSDEQIQDVAAFVYTSTH
jgi:mono/diheme cytochrome c family protein